MKPLAYPILAHRDLRNRSAEVLRRVKAGETFQVTNHGKVVAVLSPADKALVPRVRPATVLGGFGALPRVQVDAATAVVLDELRGDR